MISIKYVQPCGTQREARAQVGQSIMEVDADCGGQCACGTCHVHIAEPWRASLQPATGDELEMLSFALGSPAESRLACQVRLDTSHDGIVVRLPEGQH